jgi:hypothetical protein
MSLVWRLLVLMALSASPGWGPQSAGFFGAAVMGAGVLGAGILGAGVWASGVAAAASPGTSGNSGSSAHHKGSPRGSGPPNMQSPGSGVGPGAGSGVPGSAHEHPMVGPRKMSSKPPSALRQLNVPGVNGQGANGQGLNGPARGPGLGPQGELTARGTGNPHGTAAPSGVSGVHTLQGGGVADLSGGLPRRPAGINGSTMSARGFATAKIAPLPKANTSINGTGLGRRN